VGGGLGGGVGVGGAGGGRRVWGWVGGGGTNKNSSGSHLTEMLALMCRLPPPEMQKQSYSLSLSLESRDFKSVRADDIFGRDAVSMTAIAGSFLPARAAVLSRARWVRNREHPPSGHTGGSTFYRHSRIVMGLGKRERIAVLR